MQKNQKKFIPQKTYVPQKRKLEICRDVPGYVGMEGFKSIFDQINNYEKKKPTTHLYLLKVSQMTEKIEFLTEIGMKIQILKTIWI